MRVAFYGTGAMARLVAIELLARGHQVVGAFNPNRPGVSLAQVFGTPELQQVVITNDLDELVTERPQVVVHGTPHCGDLRGQILDIVARRLHVVSVSGMVHPWRRQPALAQELDRTAKEHEVAILGTGNNPGFMLDLIPLFFSGLCTYLEAVEARRVADLSPYGVAVARMYGLGLTSEAFEDGVKSGTILLHEEIWESVDMIADALGWELEWTHELREPIVADTPCSGEHVLIKPGNVRGFRHVATGGRDSRQLLGLELVGLVAPGSGPLDPAVTTTVSLRGAPEMRVSVEGEIGLRPAITTTARIVNVLPWVVNDAPPGLRRLIEIPLSVATVRAPSAYG